MYVHAAMTTMEMNLHLSNRDGLLLHDLMYSRAVSIQHFIKLVNAADPLVRQHQGPTFQRHLPGDRVLHDSCRQTNTRTATSSGVLTWGGREGGRMASLVVVACIQKPSMYINVPTYRPAQDPHTQLLWYSTSTDFVVPLCLCMIAAGS